MGSNKTGNRRTSSRAAWFATCIGIGLFVALATSRDLWGVQTFDRPSRRASGGRLADLSEAGVHAAVFVPLLAQPQPGLVRWWWVPLAVALGVGLVGLVAWYFITRRSAALERAVTHAVSEHRSEVGKLAAGLAHEIRNPLHAIRLNLHTVRRIQEKQLSLPADEMTAMLEQSVREVDRIEQLVEQLLTFASPDEARDEVIDVGAEIRELVEFVRQEMLDSHVQVALRIDEAPVLARLDRGRLRQATLNLLENARQALGAGGRIDVGVIRRRGRVEICVADNGPGIPEVDRRRIFKPFFSTKEGGRGLGLAMVKRFVEEAGGEIVCKANAPTGIAFRILLPEAKRARK
jgi:two-component system sensor histidine kinase PilS (NtrC family)